MDISEILKNFKDGSVSLGRARKAIGELFCMDIGCAKIDVDRLRRTGAAEVIFGEGKTPEQIASIAEKLVEKFGAAMATRVCAESADFLKEKFADAKYFPLSRLFIVDRRRKSARGGSGKRAEASRAALKGGRGKPGRTSFIAVVCAGTADLPVAEEAVETARFLGSRVELFADCGVAGLHRLLANVDRIRRAKVVVAVAGMEGALPSVLAGLVKSPVIAVPTSVGYGANFGGLSALLSMMNSCANGVSVVNIDNGFGAGFNAHTINSIR
ncbi:MAG: nickel pincer cofactor biosynthesis protein LarB [Verrucomicrobia bacterium]|nr:MAG: nickel pincer cofactor biosynthesis protein LarB [Verrucomicrobiota bacterium]